MPLLYCRRPQLRCESQQSAVCLCQPRDTELFTPIYASVLFASLGCDRASPAVFKAVAGDCEAEGAPQTQRFATTGAAALIQDPHSGAHFGTGEGDALFLWRIAHSKTCSQLESSRDASRCR